MIYTLIDYLEYYRLQVVRGGESVESERYMDFTVIVDPAPDSPLMQASRPRARKNNAADHHRENPSGAVRKSGYIRGAMNN